MQDTTDSKNMPVNNSAIAPDDKGTTSQSTEINPVQVTTDAKSTASNEPKLDTQPQTASDNIVNPEIITEVSKTAPAVLSEEVEQPDDCTCKCHALVYPLDAEVFADSCYHCKPLAHPQPKQKDYPNLNAGNNNEDKKWAEKWKTPEERILACERYCEYVRRGRSKRYYPEADENTIKRYMDNYPEEFRPEKIADAERAGFAYIEGIGFKGMTGNIKGFNATTWIWITKNKLNWRDKVQVVGEDDYETEWGNTEEKA